MAVSETPTPLRAAFEARDHEGIVDALAPGVVLRSPIFDVPFTEVEGCDLLRFDDQGRVKEITVFLRPFPGIAAFMRGMAPRLGRRRGGAGRAATLAAAGAPVSALMRATAAADPRLLGLKRG